MADDGLVNMSNQFAGLPMRDLIGGPLQAACDAQNMLAAATSNFIQDVGLQKTGDGANAVMTARTVDFSFDRPAAASANAANASGGTEKVDLKVPLLAIINTPALSVKEVDVNFTMSVNSSTSSETDSDTEAGYEGSASVHIGPFSAKVSVHGSVSSHSKDTRSSDNSAKYDVKVVARDDGPPEGLMKVLDMLNTAITPLPSSSETPA
jgi:hypothetical protein